MGHRGHNEGSIYKRDDGRWAGVISVNGKRKFIYGKTKQDAQRKMNIALRDLQAGLPIVSEKQTLEQFLISWLDMIKPTIEESTWKRHREYCELHIIPQLGRVKLAALTPQQVQEFYSDRLASGLASTTVNHLHDTLHKALKRASGLDFWRATSPNWLMCHGSILLRCIPSLARRRTFSLMSPLVIGSKRSMS